MIQASRLTEEINRKITFNKLLSKKLKWHKRPVNIFLMYNILISGPFLFMFIHYSNNLLFLIWVILTLIVMILIFHYSNKWMCKIFGWPLERKRLLYKFPQEEFEIETVKILGKGMKRAKVLKGKSKCDIRVVKSVKKNIKKSLIPETSTYPLKVFFLKSWPLVTLLYGTYAGLFLANAQDFGKTSNLVLVYFLIALMILMLAIQIDSIILDLLNTKHRTQKRLLKRLDLLELHLKNDSL